MSEIKPSALLKGLITFLPGTGRFFCASSGGTDSPRYCYAVWMRHLVKAQEAGIGTDFRRVAELGPGDSLGTGLCAILCGASEYYALDAKPHAAAGRNRVAFRELRRLFEERAAVPDAAEFPLLFPKLDDHSFPHEILPPARLETLLLPERSAAVERAIEEGEADGIRIRYAAPWQDPSLAGLEGSLDLVFSQAVMEHVEDVPGAYAALFRWLKPGGFMSHTIDYKSHGYARSWNGHWTASDRLWRLVKGRRPYFLNRLPHSAHIAAMKSAGFEIVAEIKARGAGPALGPGAAARAGNVTAGDLSIAGAFIQARKP